MFALTRPAIATIIGLGSLLVFPHFDTSEAAQVGKRLGNTSGKVTAPETKVAPPSDVELTTKECTSLGGTLGTDSKACTDKGYFTCKTVDSQGREHTACIDNK